MALITQREIIETVEVSEYLSVNKIKDSAIQKVELELEDSLLGSSLYADMIANKTGEGTFNAPYQVLYDKYLKRLLSEMVILNYSTAIILELSNKGIDNSSGANKSSEIDALKYFKAEYGKELDVSKRLILTYLEDNADTYTKYKQVDKDAEKPTKTYFFGGFYIG